ncbi:MAG TPA: hypothetical protein VIK32_01005 [Candidatus Limnocylindrales bacterium]
MILSYSRGRLVTYKRGVWRYEDGVPVDDDPNRPCPRCGRPPTAEGYDACLGHIPGCVSACCGHSVHEPILMMRVEEKVPA